MNDDATLPPTEPDPDRTLSPEAHDEPRRLTRPGGVAMAYVEGETLAKKLKGQPLEVRDAVVLVRKVALALAEAHSKGVIHRDLKPANILIDGRGEPVVMDFGLARRADSVLQLTQQGEMMGTPAYMPPEQINGDIAAMGPPCDVWSVSVMLYELLAGRLPFGGDVLATLMQITSEEAEPPSRHRAGLDPRLDAICAGVVTLEVDLLGEPIRSVGAEVTLAKAGFVLEASLGDMVTTE